MKFNDLVILELANNHFGSVELAKEIIKTAKEKCKEFEDVFQFAVKLQYRDLETFIHPDFQGNMDFKFIKRFEETKLSWEQFKEIKNYIKECGFISICTPFDENSVDKIIEHDYDIIKIASCSFTDWTLIEKIASTDKPIIASCGSAELQEIDNFVMYMQNRKKEFALMYCVTEYPTPINLANFNQVLFLKNRYKDIKIGYSGHLEQPVYRSYFDLMEFHVKKGKGNNYSFDVSSLESFLRVAKSIKIADNTSKRYISPSEVQRQTIRELQRGVYAKEFINENDTITKDNIFLAMPVVDDKQLTTGDLSKYKTHTITVPTINNLPLVNVSSVDNRKEILEIIKETIKLLKESKVAIPDNCEMEISHHLGIEKANKTGAIIFNILNTEEYCKKIIVVLKGQEHPRHFHKKKHETFHVLYGSLTVDLQFAIRFETVVSGTDDNLIVVERERNHSFYSTTGCIFEEISTKHYLDDSYYFEKDILRNNNRKTRLRFKKEWLEKDIN